MSFQAPDTDAAPPAGFKAPDDDADAPRWSDLPGNIIPDAKKIGMGAVQTGLRIGKGIYDLPEDALASGEQIIKGENPMDTPLGEDAKTVGAGVVGAVKSIPGQVMDLGSKDAWVNHPAQNALTAGSIAAPFLRGEGAAEALAKGATEEPIVPHETIPEVPEVPEVPTAAPKGVPSEPQTPLGTVYHGSNANFDSFSLDKSKGETAGIGHFFTPSIEEAGMYGRNVRPYQIDMKNPWKVTGHELNHAMDTEGPAALRNRLIQEGYDGITMTQKPIHHIVFDSSKIKPVSPLKELPILQPGLKTGGPHALFAYNDSFGPGGTPRSIYNVFGDPEHPAVKGVGHGSSITKDILDKAGIPVTGREPRSVGKWEPLDIGGEETPPLEPMAGKGNPGVPPSKMPPDPNAPAPKAAPGPEDPLKDVKDFINSKYQKMEAKGGWPEKLATYLSEESNKLGAKDLGLQGRQVQTMGQGFQGLEKANALVDYAREKGYMEPTLTDANRRTLIKTNMDKAGQQMNAIRSVADKRGAPPVPDIQAAVEQELTAKYGSGVEKASSEIANVMDDIRKAPPTFTGMSELATKLNKSATKVKDLGQHPGPTTDAANIVSRINNDAIRKTLNPKESELYTNSLRDYGAHKKLEQATAGAGRRELTARTNQRGPVGRLVQEALDRGGYRMGGNIAHKVANTVLKNPGKIKTLPQFFEELAHQSNEELDNHLDIGGMSTGGVVPHDVKEWINARGC